MNRWIAAFAVMFLVAQNATAQVRKGDPALDDLARKYEALLVEHKAMKADIAELKAIVKGSTVAMAGPTCTIDPTTGQMVCTQPPSGPVRYSYSESYSEGEGGGGYTRGDFRGFFKGAKARKANRRASRGGGFSGGSCASCG